MLIRLGYAITKGQICEGLSALSAPCKFEILSISPTIIADSTHTPIAIEEVCDSLADFKEITGTKIKLCLPDGELIPYYIEALTRRGYDVCSISALELESVGEDERGKVNIPLTLSKTVKATAKSALSDLSPDTVLLISGPSNFTRALRYELLGILGF